MARILVIDDSASALELVREILTREGHEITTADCGRRGEAALASEGFDLVITDVYMPEQDGFEVLRNVRRKHPGLQVIAMSSASGKYDMLTVAKALGAADTLRKPFNTTELREAVDACLRRSAVPGPGVPGV
jgi:DNA-binding response OmpR family regulator